MKKRLHLLSTLLGLIGLTLFSSCLKNSSNYIDFSKVGTLVELPLSGATGFSADALTESTDTIVRQFAVNIASPNPLKTDLVVTLAIDPTIITAYNASQSAIVYNAFPTAAYSFNTFTVTIPAGTRTKILSITFYKSFLDPSQSYMLPLSIKSTNNPAVTVSGNFGVHYYHFIGNDFAGSYIQDFTRYNNATGTGAPAGGSFTGATTTFSPVTPTQFEVASGYYTGTARYEVTFTKSGPGKYSNFAVTLNSDDVANIFTANGITVTQQPVVVKADVVNKAFIFQYVVQNSSGFRYCVDSYHK